MAGRMIPTGWTQDDVNRYNRTKTNPLLDPPVPTPRNRSTVIPAEMGYHPSERLLRAKRSRLNNLSAPQLALAPSQPLETINRRVIKLPARKRTAPVADVQMAQADDPAPAQSDHRHGLPSRRFQNPVTPERFYAPPPPDGAAGVGHGGSRQLGSPFHVKARKLNHTVSESEGRVRFKDPIEEDTPMHIRTKRQSDAPLTGKSLDSLPSEGDFHRPNASAHSSSRLPHHVLPIDELTGPPPIPPKSSRPPLPTPARPSIRYPRSRMPSSSPMPPFPPTPPSPSHVGSPKWPVSRHISPSTDSSDSGEQSSEGENDMDVDVHASSNNAPPASRVAEADAMEGPGISTAVGQQPDSIVIPDDEDEEETLHTETTEEDEIMGTETSTEDSVLIETLDEHTGAQDMIDGWRTRYEDLLKEVTTTRRGPDGSPRPTRRQHRILTQVLEAQMLIGTSIDLMKDCLLKYQADGYMVDADVLG